MGSLTIPEGVIRIGNGAFSWCSGMRGILSLPSTLGYIGDNAFNQCGIIGELKLPDKLKYIGSQTFYLCINLTGNLVLPENLQYLGSSAFAHCSGITGSLKIPQGITEIPLQAFSSCGFDGVLILHDGITMIGQRAFESCKFKGELNLPSKLLILEDDIFSNCNFSGEIKLPQNLRSVGMRAFENNERLSGTLEFPPSVTSISAGAFARCGFEEIIFPENLENIGYIDSYIGGAFANCFNVGRIVCKGTIPADVVDSRAFEGVPKDNFTLEVPEIVVEQYRAAPGWREFKRIAAHRELTCRPTMVKALNGKSERKLILDAEGEWEVESKPEWCTLSAMSGNKKTELTLTLESGTNYREGEIIFRLKDYDYTTSCRVYQYDFEYADDEVLVLQNHKVGQGINLIFLGDGYDAEDISRGDYLQVMNEQMERFFAIEPYRTYRDYFDVYTAIAVSPENGIGGVNTIRDTKFGTTFTNDVGLLGEYDEIFAYVMKIPSVNESNLSQSLIVITPNTTDYGGITQMWEDGSAIAFCPLSGDNYPYDARGIVQHEAGGHGFGKLGDEYIYYNSFIDDCLCLGTFKWGKALGWYENLSLTGKMHEVPWAHFIFDDRYSDVVDIYEGGFTHTRGVFRSEQNSCMNNNIQYHSAISREAIVKRIMLYAGETYSFDEFVKNDKRGSDNLSRSTRDMDFGTKARGNQYPPVIHKGRPSILK